MPRRIPRVVEAGAVVIADYRPLITFRRGPSAPLRRAVREAPGKQEGVVGSLPRRDIALHAERPHCAMGLRFGRELPVIREVVPEQHRRVPPTATWPAEPVRQPSTVLIEHA